MIRPVEPRDVPAIHALLTSPGVAPFAGRTPLDAPDVTRAALGRAGPHRLALFDGDAVRAYGEVEVVPRARMSHLAALHVHGSDAGPLIDALIDLADRWLGVGKLEAEVDAEDPAIPQLIARGFATEVQKTAARRRGPRLVNSAILGRFRSDFVPRGPATQPEWPPPGEPVRVAIRAVTLDDLAAWTALHRAPSTVWGTLQLPSATEDSWRDRLQRNTVIGQHGIVAVLDGRVVGSGGIHRLPFPADHAATLGMSVHADFQGRRVGGQILDALVAQGQALGLSRIELEVYADNPRAIALYRSRGFVEEGVRRKNALRDGAHVDSLVMAITR